MRISAPFFHAGALQNTYGKLGDAAVKREDYYYFANFERGKDYNTLKRKLI